MWIDKGTFNTLNSLIESAQNHNTEMLRREQTLIAENAMLKAELVRHVADKDWFKHRLTQVEQERAALIYAATGGHGQVPAVRDEGVKVPSPRFVGQPSMSETLNHQYNPFGTTGEDSLESTDQIPGAVAEDVSHMPGYKS